MSTQIAPQILQVLVQIISGGPGNSEVKPIGIYRSGPQIESFLLACGAEVVTQGSRLPSLYASLKKVLLRDDAAEVLRRITEASTNPADFRDGHDAGSGGGLTHHGRGWTDIAILSGGVPVGLRRL